MQALNLIKTIAKLNALKEPTSADFEKLNEADWQRYTRLAMAQVDYLKTKEDLESLVTYYKYN